MGAYTFASCIREARSPPNIAMSRSDLPGASLRWTHQLPSKVATISQIAAPQRRRGPAQIRAVPHSAGSASSLKSGD
eukprot:1078020-Pyramimonas_sp.AAC.1